MDRRNFMRLGGATGVVLLAQPSDLLAQTTPPPRRSSPRTFAGGQPNVVTPNGSTLPLREVDGVKVGHLVVGEIDHEFAPGLRCRVWGYEGSTPGPTIECTEGDRIRIYVTNRLPEPTTVHWHGIVVPNGMDGVSALTQRPIPPGETWVHELELRYPGTFMYHSHYDEMTQIALGCVGMIVVHPRHPRGPRVDRDFVLMTHEWTVNVGTDRPNPNAMNDFNVLTFNGKSFPATESLTAEIGDRVRIRIVNLGPMDHHPIHLHGHAFEVTGTDGGTVPPSARVPATTVLVPTGTVRVIEFIARAAGDWPLHCHMTHHAMNQMGHAAANLVGADPQGLDAKLSRVVPGYMTMGQSGMNEMSTMRMPQPDNSISMVGGRGPHGIIDMGGMFTLVKIREHLVPGADPGWYVAPAMAGEASPSDLLGDGITP
jgi:FtsP/CotA-like multicopper oxidase with cupredoxin domain